MAKKFGRLSSREHRDRLACGAIAQRCLKRYDRQLNAAKLADYFAQVNEKPTSRESINDYRAAYRMYFLWKRKCGGAPPHLDITKLALAHRAGPAHLSDEDKIRLCERTAQRNLTRSQMTNEAMRISKEKTRARLRYQLHVSDRRVEQIDGLELLRNCGAASVDVVILDWMYQLYLHRANNDLPRVHVPEDPVAHIIKCLSAARVALVPHGCIALFAGHRDDHDRRILEGLEENGLRRVDQYVSQTLVGNFTHAVGATYTNCHEVVDIYRLADVEVFPKRMANIRSVSPKWHNRNHRVSAERAVHPCEKSVELMMNLIRPVTVNGLVADPFCGSGSSGVAAVQLGCNFLGAELVPEYVEIANRRITLAVDREEETQSAINVALEGANPEQQAAIEDYLNHAGIELIPRGETA